MTEEERLRGIVERIDDLCSSIVTEYPPSNDRDAVARSMLDLINDGGGSR